MSPVFLSLNSRAVMWDLQGHESVDGSPADVHLCQPYADPLQPISLETTGPFVIVPPRWKGGMGCPPY